MLIAALTGRPGRLRRIVSAAARARSPPAFNAGRRGGRRWPGSLPPPSASRSDAAGGRRAARRRRRRPFRPAPRSAASSAARSAPALSDADRQAAWNAQIAALDSGQRRSWRGAHGVFGFVEPGAETGAGCRSYEQTIYVAGRPNHGQGVACKQPDGGWKMTS